MDTLTNLSLFSGAGGLDLGAKLVGGFRTVAYVEFDMRAQATLISRMRAKEIHDAPIFEDVRTFDGRSLAGNIDVVSGGFPCQDVSSAGMHKSRKSLETLISFPLCVNSHTQTRWLQA